MNWNNLKIPDNPYYKDDWVVIYHADCRDILPLIPDKSIDLVLTDPPYGVHKDYGQFDDNNKSNDYWELMDAWFRWARASAQLIVLTPGMVNFTAWMGQWSPDWVCCWYKSNQCSFNHFGGANLWEPVLLYGKTLKRLNIDAWNIPIGQQDKTQVGNHCVPKSARFWSILTEVLTENNHIILDPFLGSGTTAYCAKKLNRRCIGVEIEEKYCEIAAKRCSQQVFDFREEKPEPDLSIKLYQTEGETWW